MSTSIITIKCRTDYSNKSLQKTFHIGTWFRRLVRENYKLLGKRIEERHFCVCIDVDFSLERSEDGCAVYRLTDGDLSMRAVFTSEAIENNFDSMSSDDTPGKPAPSLSKSVVLLETFSLLHAAVSGVMFGDFILQVHTFVWQPYSNSCSMVDEMIHRAPQFIWCYDDPQLQPLVEQCHNRKTMVFSSNIKLLEGRSAPVEKTIEAPVLVELSPPASPPPEMLLLEPPLLEKSPEVTAPEPPPRPRIKLHAISTHKNLSECLDFLYKSQTAKGLLIPSANYDDSELQLKYFGQKAITTDKPTVTNADNSGQKPTDNSPQKTTDINADNSGQQSTTTTTTAVEKIISDPSQPLGLTPISRSLPTSSQPDVDLLVIEAESSQDDATMPEGFTLRLGSSCESSAQSLDRLQLSPVSPEVITISDDENSQNISQPEACDSKGAETRIWKSMFSSFSLRAPVVSLKRLSPSIIKAYENHNRKMRSPRSPKVSPKSSKVSPTNKSRLIKWVPRTMKKSRVSGSPKKTIGIVSFPDDDADDESSCSNIQSNVSPTCLKILKQLSGKGKYDNVLGGWLTESQMSLPLSDSLQVQNSQTHEYSSSVLQKMPKKKRNGEVRNNLKFTSLKTTPKKSNKKTSQVRTERVSTVYQDEFSKFLASASTSKNPQPVTSPFMSTDDSPSLLADINIHNRLLKQSTSITPINVVNQTAEAKISRNKGPAEHVKECSSKNLKTIPPQQTDKIIYLDDSDDEQFLRNLPSSVPSVSTHTPGSSALSKIGSLTQIQIKTVHITSEQCHNVLHLDNKNDGVSHSSKASRSAIPNLNGASPNSNIENSKSFYSAVVSKMLSGNKKSVKRKSISVSQPNKKQCRSGDSQVISASVPAVDRGITGQSNLGSSVSQPSKKQRRTAGSQVISMSVPTVDRGITGQLNQGSCVSQPSKRQCRSADSQVICTSVPTVNRGITGQLNQESSVQRRKPKFKNVSKASDQGNLRPSIHHGLTANQCPNFLSHGFGGSWNFPDSFLATMWNHFIDLVM